MKQTDLAIQNIPGVAKTDAEYELAEGFTTIEDVLQIVSIAVIAVLLVVTHAQNLVDSFHKRVISINEGVIVDDGMEAYYTDEN